MKVERIEFTNAEGILLSARLELPVDERPSAYTIFAHCFTCSKDLQAVVNISRSLTQKGMAVLRFDFTGLGESQGEFSDTNFSSNISDLLSAYEHLAKKYKSPQLVIGHSLGGAAVLAAAEHMPEIKAVVTIGAPSTPDHVTHLFNKNLAEIEAEGEADVKIGGRPFKIKKQFLRDINQTTQSKKIATLNRALLVLHSPQDAIVGIENAREIYEQAHHPKSYISLDGADHLLSKKSDSVYAGNLISSWAARYVSLEKTQTLETEQQVSVRTGEKDYVTEVKTENHYLLADEPLSLGGTDLGPTPYDLLVAALGTCTSITLRMYANHKKLNLKEVRVHLQHSKEHKEDCENADSNESKIDHINREIELIGNLTQEEKDRLLEIADKCPVHRTLHSEVVIKTNLV